MINVNASKWPGANYIALYHPTGKLWMAQDVDRDTCKVDYHFEFTDLPDLKNDIIKITGHALSITNRFGGQSAIGYSVLRHSMYIGECMRRSGVTDPSVIFAGLMHDMSEAYFADVPRPFKTDEDRAREIGIMRATPWTCLHGDIPHEGLVKYWDNVALVIEAEKYGHPQWIWTQGLRQSLPLQEVDLKLYEETMDSHSNYSEDFILDKWIRTVLDVEDTL